MTCSASESSGTVPTHDVTDVAITCSDEAYNLGGTVAGLTTSGLVLREGSADTRVPAGATGFTMPTAIARGSRYAVRVQAQPAGLTCSISGGTGTMMSSAITNVRVICAAAGYTLGGTLSGLRTSGLVLSDGRDDLSVSANATQFSMPNSLADGSDYAITIKSQPASGTCQISHASGTVSGDVGSVQILCAAAASP
jgi:hypothetical protein